MFMLDLDLDRPCGEAAPAVIDGPDDLIAAIREHVTRRARLAEAVSRHAGPPEPRQWSCRKEAPR